MKWRKQYHAIQERKDDQHRGFFACLGLNATLLFAWYASSAGYSPQAPTALELFLLALPWIINIGVLVIALIVRPEFAVGYLAFFAMAIVGAILLGIVFLVACFATIATAVVLIPLKDVGGFIAGVCVLPGVFLGGLYFLGKALLPEFRRWWSGD